MGLPWDRVLQEIAKCDVRCANCQPVMTMTKGRHFRQDGWGRSGDPQELNTGPRSTEAAAADTSRPYDAGTVPVRGPGRPCPRGVDRPRYFLVLGVVGLALLVVSLVMRDLFDGVFDALPGDVFSSAVLGGFVSAFGFGTALSQGLGAPLGLAVPLGVARWAPLRLVRLVAHPPGARRPQRRHGDHRGHRGP